MGVFNMVAELERHDGLNFEPTTPDRLPPQNIEIEENILGGILLDPDAIHRVKSRLKPEHFYLPVHKQIYKACLAIAKAGQSPELLQLTAYLTDKNLIKEIGGRGKLIQLLDQTVTSVNIDALANVLIQKHARRELIKLGSDVTQFAYSGELELEDVLEMVRRRTERVINLDAAKTQDELIKDRHDRLIAAIKHIYTTVPSPSERLMRMMYLAREFDLSVKFLEQLYMKSLVDSCSTLMTYEELKIAAGNNVREWLQQGLVPVGSSILLGADGGVGKTNLAYTIAKHLAQGTNLGDFHSTGGKRRILIYQGDEQPADTAEKLELMGYDDNDIGKCVRCRYGWSFESISYLIKDVIEFKPHLIVFDSLSFGNRFSTFTENETEYARPILEINGILAEHKCTAIFIHHTNRDGGFRGATAIRNAVSEAWLLYPSRNTDATPYDRILEINKSRSRSSSKKYKLYFDSYTLEYSFLGEETTDTATDDKGAKDRLLRFFHENRNTLYEAEEIGYKLHISTGHARKTLSALSGDGLISAQRRPGRATRYYLAYVSPIDLSPPNCKEGDQGSDPRSPDDHLDDHLHDSCAASVTAEGDQVIIENAIFENSETENLGQNRRSRDHLLPECPPSKDNEGDPVPDPSPLIDAQTGDHDQLDDHLAIADQQSSTQMVQTQTQEKPPEPQIKKVRVASAAGDINGVAESLDNGKTWKLMWRFPVGKQKQRSESDFVGDDMDAMKRLSQVAKTTSSYWRYRVTFNGQTFERCKCVELPNPHGINKTNYIFMASDDRVIHAQLGEFEWQPPGGN